MTLPSASPPLEHLAPTSASSVYLIYASVYACGALFAVPSAVALHRLAQNWQSDRTAIKLYALLTLGALLRALAFVLVAIWMSVLFASHVRGALDHDAAHLHLSYLQLVFLWQVLGELASLVLCGVFLLVFNTWASMVDRVQGSTTTSSNGKRRHNASDALLLNLHTYSPLYSGDRRDSGASSASGSVSTSSLVPPPPPRLLFTRLMMAVYLLQMAMFLFAQQEPQSDLRRGLLLVATTLLGCCWGACVVLLPAYGTRMCRLLDKVAEDASHRQKNVRRIATIAALFCLMHTLALLLLAASQCTPPSRVASSASINAPDKDQHWPHIPLKDIVQANPAFFFPSGWTGNQSDGLLRWVVMVEVLEFPLEWALLMALLCVLPSRAKLPVFHGYRAIPDRSHWRA